MTIESWLELLSNTALAIEIREGESWFPFFESIHVLSICLVFGTIALIDFRLLGWGSRDRLISGFCRAVLPLTWSAFGLAACSGLLLFCSNALTYAGNIWFIAKFAFIGLAGLNMLIFQMVVFKHVQSWDAWATPPASARRAGLLSLIFWVAVITCGRWVGFTLQPGMD